MLISIFRIKGSEQSLTYLTEKIDIFDDEIMQDDKGRINGINIDISESSSLYSHFEELSKFLNKFSSVIQSSSSHGCHWTLDIGCSVGEKNIYARFLSFSPEILEKLVSNKIHLEISAYPAGD
ncbi:hypothetical protein [Endozoicomonas arenosclerae]|uniref:hypothetical protein n=1 Tax=Endozoicomonas arenosclerae TaxID=1633495 RepID=UPI0007820D39|nr:hypothetical protein [Endozoicomonas arenosclerae]